MIVRTVVYSGWVNKMADYENYDSQDENDKEYAVIPGIPPIENPREKKSAVKDPGISITVWGTALLYK